ncbi:chitin binding domain-containing protein [Kitasatospora sp. NBC_01287]|uniref:chitin binding peritrophin-A domain-containing protein n=1 Tax=Kitasatospora sp. NBC_01287 TaxID=2903573 RepID=UPI00224F811C|nr:chitin binding peritrophin-A domain-containing protein [Kitasatospora sp. NBC_01287]MCX4751188.1 chitin binding domain-containing protein [Kitasatospora sp. NBC_01287]
MPPISTRRRMAVLLASTALSAAAATGSSAAATVHTAVPRIAAADGCDGHSHGDLYPDESDAGAFYQCSWGNAYHFKCPSILHFNDTIKVCDWPENAGNPYPIADQFSDTAGPAASGAAPNTVRATRTTRPAAGIDLGGQINYSIAITSPQPHTAAHIQFSYPAGLSWVGGQDCFHYTPGQVDCMVYPAANGFPASTFTLQAGLLDLGSQTVTAHVVATDPPAATPIPDTSLTCTAVTGSVVIC